MAERSLKASDRRYFIKSRMRGILLDDADSLAADYGEETDNVEGGHGRCMGGIFEAEDKGRGLSCRRGGYT